MREFVGSLPCTNLWVPLNAQICGFLWFYGSIELATLWVPLSAPTCGLPSMRKAVGSLPSTCYRVRSWVASNQPPPNQPHPPSSTCYRVRSWVASSPAHPATNPTGHPPNQHQPQSHPPMPSTCYRAHSWVASALSWLGPLWHWVVCGIGQLHPVHPCFTAQLLCAVLLRSQDRNRLRTPGKHHLIIHHHLCRESQIPAADLSKNSSNKYQGDFGSYRQRTLPRRLCGQDSPSSALRELHYEETIGALQNLL